MTPDTIPIFVYGTLRDADVLATVLDGAEARLRPQPATLSDYTVLCAVDGPFPVLRTRTGARAEGMLLTPMDREIADRLDFFEGSYDYALETRQVETADGPVQARVYIPRADEPDTGAPWDLEVWRRTAKPVFLEMSDELTARQNGGTIPNRRSVLFRALQRVNARAEAPAVLRSQAGPGAVAVEGTDRCYSGFFATEIWSYRHRLFRGGMSDILNREVFVTGDAVAVLPWDPRSDRLLLIEQVRAGLIARGDPNPWNLEVIAGIQDRQEPPEETARREAREEAGLALGRMVLTGRYYTSPGSLTEFITSFIAEADLSAYSPGVHGLASEHEDIRTMIVSREEALRALDSGEARNAPLMLALHALERQRGALADAWSAPVAKPAAPV
ncbi:MAG: gamma-glutamylcyclotransferase [Pseudomonadota bacterium]